MVIILDTDGTVIFVVRTKNGHIDIVRVFSMGDTYQISIDFKELICRSYIDDITLFSIKLLELGKDFK